MATADIRALSRPSRTIVTLVAADGSAHAAQLIRLCAADASLRDLADAVHAMCLVHGAFPGVVDQARDAVADAAARVWLDQAAEAMAQERALLARLTAAVGPLPSTPGHAASETVILAQRQALGMLARSDRDGCALGTALAFVLDWQDIRRVLDAAATHLSIPVDGIGSTVAGDAAALLARLDNSSGVDRAMMFGAEQLLAQHRGLWNLLEARASARDAG